MSHSAHGLHSRKIRAKEDHLLGKVILVVAFVEPLSTVGQIWQIHKTKDIHGNSLLTWCLYDLAVLIWLIYALKIKNKPLIITEFLWFVVQTVVILQILYYS